MPRDLRVGLSLGYFGTPFWSPGVPREVVPAPRAVCVSPGGPWGAQDLSKSADGATSWASVPGQRQLHIPSAELLWPQPICSGVSGLLNPISEPHTLALVKDDLKSEFLHGGVCSPMLSQNFNLPFWPQVESCFGTKKLKTNRRKSVGVF